MNAYTYNDICFNGICCIDAPKPKAERDAQAHQFKPKAPKPLTPEEAAKSVRQRIQENFIGELPEEIDRLISRITEPENNSQQDASLPNRVLITGDTGTGKTHLVEVLLHELQVKSISLAGPSFANKYCGEGSRRIHEVFENAKALNEPVIIFIDYVDTLAFKMKDTSHPEYKRDLETLLRELENVQNNKNVFVIFATHEPEILDKRFVEKFPGKSHAKLSYLNEEERAALFMKYFEDHDLEKDSELAKELAKNTNNKIDKHTRAPLSNRALEDIVTAARFRKYVDCKEKKRCDEPIRTYLQKETRSL